jgi:hypothetical protein
VPTWQRSSAVYLIDEVRWLAEQCNALVTLAGTWDAAATTPLSHAPPKSPSTVTFTPNQYSALGGKPTAPAQVRSVAMTSSSVGVVPMV